MAVCGRLPSWRPHAPDNTKATMLILYILVGIALAAVSLYTWVRLLDWYNGGAFTPPCTHPYPLIESHPVSSTTRVVVVSRLGGEPRGYVLTEETRRCQRCGGLFGQVSRFPRTGLTFVGEPVEPPKPPPKAAPPAPKRTTHTMN